MVMSVYYRSRFAFLSIVLLFLLGILAIGQDSGKNKNSKDSQAQNASQSDQDQDPLKRPVKPEQQKKATLEKETGFYKRWVNEDVRWIIADEELSAWKKLTTNAERDNF